MLVLHTWTELYKLYMFHYQLWSLTKYIYLSTVLQYIFWVSVPYFIILGFGGNLYLPSIAFQRQMLYYTPQPECGLSSVIKKIDGWMLYYIFLTALVTPLSQLFQDRA